MEYKKIPEKLVRKMLLQAHDPQVAKIRSRFLSKEYSFLKRRIQNQQVLVAGSGLGHDSFVLAPTNKRVVGVEIIPSFVEEARRKAQHQKLHNVEFYNDDILCLPHPQHYFDAVVLTMGTIGNFDDMELLIRRLLYVGKKLYFDFYSSSKRALLRRKKMYEEESNYKIYIKGSAIFNNEGFETKSYSKKSMKKLIRGVGASVKFFPILNFAYIAEVQIR